MVISSRFFILALLLLSTSCATKVAEFRQSPEFTREAIVAYGVVIGGYAAPKIDLKKMMGAMRDSGDGKSRVFDISIDPDRSALNSKILEEAVRAKRSAYPVEGYDAFFAGMGKERYQEFAGEYFRNRAPGEKWLDAIRNLKTKGRYLLLAREESNTVKYISHNKKETENKKNVKSKIHSGKEITFETRRTMEVLFTVYDLKTGEEVWNGKIKKSISKTSRQKAYIGSSSAGISLKSGNLLGEREPDSPREIDILKELFEAFALSLPE